VKYLLDTCVISELVKRKPDDCVLSWLQSQNEGDLYLSVLTFGELEKGVEKAPGVERRKTLQHWIENDLKKRFKERVISIDMKVAIKWGTIQAGAELCGKPMPAIDGLIAVSGLVHHCTVVTRNTSDMEQSSVDLLNPWLSN
jgi:predicted nucleic acid-binding protein